MAAKKKKCDVKYLTQGHVIMTREFTLGHVDCLPNDGPAHQARAPID